MNKVLVCTPVLSGVGAQPYFHHAMMWQHIGVQKEYLAGLLVVGPRRTPREIRNEAGRKLKAGKGTHLFSLDDDIWCPPNIIDLLLAVDKPIVGALVHNSEGVPLVWEGNAQEGEWTKAERPGSGAFPCWAVAMGAMLIKREVFEALPEPWFYYDKTGRTMDVHFCRDAQAAGFAVWCSVDAAAKQTIHDERGI